MKWISFPQITLLNHAYTQPRSTHLSPLKEELQGRVMVKDSIWNQTHLGLNANFDLTNLILPF